MTPTIEAGVAIPPRPGEEECTTREIKAELRNHEGGVSLHQLRRTPFKFRFETGTAMENVRRAVELMSNGDCGEP